MNFSRIITREEPIGGLAISDDSLRFVFFDISKKEKNIVLAEEVLPAGIIEGGIIKNRDGALLAFQNLVKKIPKKIRCVVVSLPPDYIYSKIFSFPKIVTKEKLEDAMKLAVGFQLPIKPNETYIDWHGIGINTAAENEKTEVSLFAIPKDIVDAYLGIFAAVGLNPVAVESYPLSLLRGLDIPQEKIILISFGYSASHSVFIVKNGILRFIRTLPRERFPEDAIPREIKRISDFYLAEGGMIDEIIDKEHLRLKKENSVSDDSGEESKWIVSAGAALRGLIPRSDDRLTSLLPVGSEKAYEHQKALVFSQFMYHLVIGVSIFFIGAYGVTWAVVGSFKNNISIEFNKQRSLPIPEDMPALQARAADLNSALAAITAATAASPSWSGVIANIQNKAGGSIRISGISLGSPTDPVAISGIAVNRTDLDVFRNDIRTSPYFNDIKLSTGNILAQTNVSFSATITLKDPGSLSQ